MPARAPTPAGRFRRQAPSILGEHLDAIQHATYHGRKPITASTADLQAFVLQHEDRFTGAFSWERDADE